MQITASQVKELREKTGAGMMDCKLALQKAGGDIDKAVEDLRKSGILKAEKKAERATGEGMIGSYVHAGSKLAVLVEINCETDFAARSDQFQAFAKDIAMHVAAQNPLVVSREEVPEALVAKERDIYREQAVKEGKPEKVVDKIVDGKLEKYFSEICLMEQPYVKDTDITIEEFLKQTIATLGENIRIRRFVRMKLGETQEKSPADASA
ncbi:MAG: translation elongation factor Ts [Candidatus Eisenbacteria bacterium]|nr:translation elongation factor Ts [Candidatus Eisenbacteria bacterium]